MRDVRAQYFLSYAVLGCVLPYAPVFFRHAGLGAVQIGYAYALWSAAVVLSPVLVTLLADTRVDPRRLMALILGGSGACLLALGAVDGVWPILAVWTAYCLVSLPLLPLQDGICFSLQRRRREQGGEPLPYHRVRVWGTVGFIVPSLLLFLLLYAGMPVRGALMSGAAFAALAAVQAVRLDDPRAAHGDAETPAPAAGPGVPTLRAARTLLLRPALLVFCVVGFLGQMASTIYAAFYPVYLTEQAGVAAEWVGLVANVGVVVEVFFILATGWLTARFGVRHLVAIGLACSGVRLALLAASDHPAVAVGTQALHGIMVVSLWVVPQAFVDRFAGDRDRHSMQGVWVMLMGLGRAAGSLTGGPVAAWWGLGTAFAYAAALCAAGTALVLLAFRDPDAADARRPAEVDAPPSPAALSTTTPASPADAAGSGAV